MQSTTVGDAGLSSAQSLGSATSGYVQTLPPCDCEQYCPRCGRKRGYCRPLYPEWKPPTITWYCNNDNTLNVANQNNAALC